MIELVRAGRSPDELAKEFEPTAQSIRNWVAQADLDEGRRHDGCLCYWKQPMTAPLIRLLLAIRARSSGRSCRPSASG